MSALVCEGCGRPAGPREVFCPDCGRDLPGRRVPVSDAAPPGWLVAAGPRGDAGLYEPLPSMALPSALAAEQPAAQPASSWTLPDWTEEPDWPAPEVLPAAAGPGWSVRESPREQARRLAEPAPEAEEPAELPLLEATADGAALVVGDARPPLRVLYHLLLAVVMVSSVGAVLLLVLHVLLDR